MKKSFVLHLDTLEVLNELNNEQRGELFYAIYNFQTGNEIELSPIIKILFSQFKSQFKRDKEKWDVVVKRNKENGSKGGRPKTQINPAGFRQTRLNPKKGDTENVNVSVSVSVSDSVNVSVSDIYNYWNEKTGQLLKGDKTIIKNLKAILKDYTVEDIKKVIDYVITNKWHIENRQVLLSVVSKPIKFPDKLDRALNGKSPAKNISSLHRCNDKDYSGEF